MNSQMDLTFINAMQVLETTQGTVFLTQTIEVETSVSIYREYAIEGDFREEDIFKALCFLGLGDMDCNCVLDSGKLRVKALK